MGDVPALGQHTDAILEELGFGAGHRRRLAQGGNDLMAIKQGWTGRVFEDFAVGDVYEHPLGRTVIARRQHLVHVPDDEHEPDSLRRGIRGADRVQAAARELVLHAGAGHRAVGDRPHDERRRQPRLGRRARCRTRCSRATRSMRAAKCSRCANRNRARRSASSASRPPASIRTATPVIEFTRTFMIWKRGHVPSRHG